MYHRKSNQSVENRRPQGCFRPHLRKEPEHSHILTHKLREARQAKGWSTLAVATMIGIRENDLYRYEFRLVKPNGDTLVKWLETLGFKILDPDGLGHER